MNSENLSSSTLKPHNINMSSPFRNPIRQLSTISENPELSEISLISSHTKVKSFTKLQYLQSTESSENNQYENISEVKFGCLNFYSILNRNVSKLHKNKIRIILNVKKPEKLSNEKWPPCSFFGLYTAHSGNACAKFLKRNLHKYIINDIHFPNKPKLAILNAFMHADSEFIKYASENCNFSGAFAIITLIIGRKCYMANTGNSKGIVSDGERKIFISKSHDLENSEEIERVTKSGAVVYRDFVVDSQGNKQETGDLKIMPMKKKFTRSFGDIDAKIQEYGGKKNIIIPNPHIKSFKIKEKYDFIVLGSESLFEKFNFYDVLTSSYLNHTTKKESFASQLHENFENDTNQSENHSMILIGFNKLLIENEKIKSE